MNVLRIRAHKRFAVCRKVRLGMPAGRPTGALLIELSLAGCRISNVDTSRLAEGDTVSLRPAGIAPFEGTVRWLGDGTAGLRLVRPFHIDELDTLIRWCRGEPLCGSEGRAYGT
ncbi:MAG: hypothetical protein KDE55_16380 [Novosphingobium sp.]|nr:hypothetical protein [Novosphingobium sp.]